MSKKNFNGKMDYPAGTLFVGIDIAKEEHCARAVENRNLSETESLFFTNDRKGFESFMDKTDKWRRGYDCSRVVMGMEPTAGYWTPLFAYLEDAGCEVKLVSSLKVKRSKDLRDNSPLKSDRKDAMLIAQLVREGNVLDYGTCDDDRQEVKDLVNLVDDLNKTKSVYRNRLEFAMSVHFPEIGKIFKEMGSPTMRALLREYPFPADMVKAGVDKIERLLWKASRGQMGHKKAERLVELAGVTVGLPRTNHARRLKIKVILNALDSMKILMDDAKSRLKEKLKLFPEYPIFRSIKGIGVITAGAIIAYLGDLTQYGNARQLLKMAGLNLYRYSSGKYKGHDRITRRGSDLLRKCLYMAALQQTHKGAPFYEKYRSMVKRGMPKKKALVAIMRKLLKVLHALVRDNRLFEPKYEGSRGAERDVSVIKRAGKKAA